jgi:two-component system sensor histidine kinase UhpB
MPMSLRCRLIALMATAFALSLMIGGAVMLLIASNSVRTEMHSALLVGHQTVENAVREIDRSSDPQRALDNLVASFKGSRHLRVWTTGGAVAEVWPAGERWPFGKVPRWFARLIGVSADTERVAVTSGGQPFATIILATAPANEILEVWNEFTGNLLILALIGGLTIPLIYLFTGRALRPLDRLTAAMGQVGNGDYRVRIGDRLTPELACLRDGFNHMAARLEASDADNRRLNEQLLTLQEEERAEIARDLHDEVGPFLFAINVDLANMTRLLREGRTAELPGNVGSIGEAVRHLQRQVRGMLGRLRPIGLAEFGLGEALSGLVEFWRRRYPEIAYRVEIELGCESLGEPAGATVYRIAQECLSNSIRHGKPRRIAVSVGRAAGDGEVIVAVTDDGAGVRQSPALGPALGYGLIGMEERVRAMGGRLWFANRPEGGFAVTAALPYRSRDGAEALRPEPVA